jgi:C1A family cysteine protease
MNEPIAASPSAEFIEYENKKQAGTLSASRSLYPLGGLPPYKDFSHYYLPRSRSDVGAMAFPTSYDLRNYNAVTPIRNQNPWGTCWTFGTIASSEGYIKRNFLRDEDYSEKHATNKCGWEGIDENSGGWSETVAGYAFAQVGLVDESDDPYPTPPTWTSSPNGLSRTIHMDEYRVLPHKTSDTDLDLVKQHLTDYGPVTISMMWDSGYYNSGTSSFYNDGTIAEPEGGHCVCCIGWDDNFSRTNFLVDPGIDGAILIKNSWGTNWGDSGYFWISYADTYVGYNTNFNLSIPLDTFPYSGIYQHDYKGWIQDRGYGGTSDAWAAKTFQVDPNNPYPIQAINMVTTTGNQTFTVYVYIDSNSTNPRSGRLVYQSSSSYTYAGIHTYIIDPKISLVGATSFSVVIHFPYVDYAYQVGCEGTRSTYVTASPIVAGQSFISSTGSGWYDAVNASPHWHINIKALTGLSEIQPTVTSVITNTGKASLIENEQKAPVINAPEEPIISSSSSSV